LAYSAVVEVGVADVAGDVSDVYAAVGIERKTCNYHLCCFARGSPVVGHGDVPSDWYWEGHVQTVMVSYLRREGWTVTAESNTAIRARGDDIAATRDGRQLVVEVKGYPSVGYRDPRRDGEVKRTNPALQAKHWFADALLKLVRIRGTRSQWAAAMAFPEAPRYRSLIEETREPLRKLGIGLFIVFADGQVEVVLEPRPPER